AQPGRGERAAGADLGGLGEVVGQPEAAAGVAGHRGDRARGAFAEELPAGRVVEVGDGHLVEADGDRQDRPHATGFHGDQGGSLGLLAGDGELAVGARGDVQQRVVVAEVNVGGFDGGAEAVVVVAHDADGGGVG